MARKGHTTELISGKPSAAEVALAKGNDRRNKDRNRGPDTLTGS